MGSLAQTIKAATKVGNNHSIAIPITANPIITTITTYSKILTAMIMRMNKDRRIR